MNHAAHPQEFDVIELRRYIIRDGARNAFARRFESWFPEAFQQLGAIVFAAGLERDDAAMFTWLRGFRDMPARAGINGAFYYGPLWKEHRQTMNDMLIDSDNVLLLRPLSDARRVPVLPAVDVVQEGGGAAGILVLQIFTIGNGGIETFARAAEPVFARYRALGLREAGVLATLDAPNNFPPLPVRTDGPHLVWIGILRDEAMLDAWRRLGGESRAALVAGGPLRSEEIVVIDPAPRSRLRWLTDRRERP